MQQQKPYVPAVSAMTMNGDRTGNGRTGGMDWSGEVTPLPQQRRIASDTGIGGMVENGVMCPEARDRQNQTQNQMQPQNSNLNMCHNLPDDVVESPMTTGEVYAGSLKAMLRRNLGNYVVATFLVGTQGTVSWEGVLYDVGNDYVTIYQAGRDRYIVNDIYSLKYMEFYDVRRRQLCDRLIMEQEMSANWQPNR